jgi:hypothetical protein
MSRYASKTSVPVDRTRREIESVLERYGADQFISGWESGRSMLGFRIKNRMVRFELILPPPDPRRQVKIDQETRQRWRALLLVIKAKLEAVESNISTLEKEFLAHLVLPNNQTVAEALLPQIAHAYETGAMPRLLGTGETVKDGKIADGR